MILYLSLIHIFFLSLLSGYSVSIPIIILQQVVLGIIGGFLLGFVFMKLIEKLSLDEDGLFSVFIATLMIGTYALTQSLGGNGFLALYVLGIYIGNHEFKKKRDVVFFFDGLSTIFQIAMFFLLGLLSDIHLIVDALPIGFILAIFMLIIARPLSVFGLMAPFKIDVYKRQTQGSTRLYRRWKVIDIHFHIHRYFFHLRTFP